MLILTIRTDQPEAEIGLFEGDEQLTYETWQAHRQLAETVHTKIKDMLASKNHQFDDLNGVAVFKGPGSFTGLRIGISVANALANGLKIPVVGESGGNWAKKAIMKLQKGENDRIILPKYGGEPHITQPKH